MPTEGSGAGARTRVPTLASSTERSMFHPRSALTNPRAVTPSHLVTMAFHESLDVAERDALLDMVRWLHAIVPAGSVTETQLYRAASLVADMRVTQVVNVKKGIHLRFPKAVLEGSSPALRTRRGIRKRIKRIPSKVRRRRRSGATRRTRKVVWTRRSSSPRSRRRRLAWRRRSPPLAEDIDEIAQLLANAELATAAMEQEEISEMRRSRDRTREGADTVNDENDDEHEKRLRRGAG